MNFEALVQAIADIHRQTQSTAAKAVNVALTLRNWLMGAYIVEFEQRGEDRAAYGERLLPTLAERLKAHSLPRADERELRRYRTLYLAYPKIRESLTPEFAGRLLGIVASLDCQSPTNSSATLTNNGVCWSRAAREREAAQWGDWGEPGAISPGNGMHKVLYRQRGNRLPD